MFFVYSITTDGPSCTRHETLTQAVDAWNDCKMDSGVLSVKLENDRGLRIMQYERGNTWEHEVIPANPIH